MGSLGVKQLFAALVPLLLVLTGCGVRTALSPGGGSSGVLQSTVATQPAGAPFTLELLEEVNDGEKVTIKGQIRAHVERGVDDVVVRLSALSAAGVPVVELRRVSALLPPGERLSPMRPAQFAISLPFRGGTNYQLELLWGEDAAPLVVAAKDREVGGGGDTAQRLVLRNLEVHRVPSERCGTPQECSVSFTITGELFNAGRATVQAVTLETGFLPATELDGGRQRLESRRTVEVRNLALAPSAAKPFRVTLEKAIPPELEVAPRPVVRVVSVATDQR